MLPNTDVVLEKAEEVLWPVEGLDGATLLAITVRLLDECMGADRERDTRLRTARAALLDFAARVEFLQDEMLELGFGPQEQREEG